MVKVVFGLEGLWNCLKANKNHDFINLYCPVKSVFLEHTFYRTVQINKVMIFI